MRTFSLKILFRIGIGFSFLFGVTGSYVYWSTKKSDPKPKVLEVKLSPEAIKIGDVIHIDFRIEMPWYRYLKEGISFEAPPGLQILGSSQKKWPSLGWGLWTWETSIELQAYEFGPFTGLTANLGISLDTAGNNRSLLVPIPTIVINSRLEEEEPDLRVATELPREFLNDRKSSSLNLVLFIAAGCGIIGVLVFLFRTNGKVKIVESPKPWKLAEIAVFNLEDRLPLDAETVFVELTDIIRNYIEAVYVLPATETTTPEFLKQIKREGTRLSVDHGLLLTDFLTAADMVKFAKLDASQIQIGEAIKKAKRFIVETSESIIRDDAQKEENLSTQKNIP